MFTVSEFLKKSSEVDEKDDYKSWKFANYTEISAELESLAMH